MAHIGFNSEPFLKKHKGESLVHGAAFPVLPYFTQGIASKIKAVQEGQGYGHSSEEVNFLLHIFAPIASPKSGHFDPSFDCILNRQGGKYCRILISSFTKYRRDNDSG